MKHLKRRRSKSINVILSIFMFDIIMYINSICIFYSLAILLGVREIGSTSEGFSLETIK